ncbi:alpha/beta fold hydrolase [Microbulbifer sp. JSM ZJ756]|uniref:alpha/beta fold hydrolase n=1 Tax=Microbulbifer sp. JSM ZJ756 TaxID=3376191 RepID=UPI0037AE7348
MIRLRERLTFKLKLLSIPAALLCGTYSTHAVSTASEETFVFETWSKQTASGYRGEIKVPENRQRPDSRMIPLRYVRFPATGESSGPPIIYLAGGPGGSGIMAVNYRFGMFMALRQFGDVIALDQRGTGQSSILPECHSGQRYPASGAVSDREYIERYREAVRECMKFWQDRGIDLAGYNTRESARDLDALRAHLGAEAVVLWGTSYGSHLALAALGEMENRIARIVLSSAEGLDQTVKLPSSTAGYLDRLQAAVDSQPRARAAYPDIKGLIERVHGKLDLNPVPMQLTKDNGTTVDYLLERRDMQLIASSFIADPRSAARLLDFYRALDQGEQPAFDSVPRRYFPDAILHPGEPISLNAMPTAMDIASGIGKDRSRVVAREAKHSLLHDYLNFSYHLQGLAPELDLGDEFRQAPRSKVPVLLFSGTLDGRTDINEQRAAVSGLENLTAITVENAGHNLFMSSEQIQLAINRFMAGEPAQGDRIVIPLPELGPKTLRE